LKYWTEIEMKPRNYKGDIEEESLKNERQTKIKILTA